MSCGNKHQKTLGENLIKWNVCNTAEELKCQFQIHTMNSRINFILTYMVISELIS